MTRSWRAYAGSAAAGVCVLGGLVAAPTWGALTTLPAAIAVGGASGLLVAGRRARPLVGVVGCVAGVASLAATAGVLLTGQPYEPGNGAASGWGLPELAGLLVLTVVVARAAPRRLVLLAGLTGIAVPAWLLRFWSGPPTEAAVGGGATWLLLALTAIAIGLYLRSLDELRSRSVTEARRTQRLRLARDLHDYVGHDISGMLAQAQAGQILAERDPAATQSAFRRIEQAGTQALASMDAALRMLGAGAGGSTDETTALPTLDDLPDVVDRFAASSAVEVHLNVDGDTRAPAAWDGLPAEVTITAHRVVVEALTNVRRHAPAATHVAVDVHQDASARGVEVTITDDCPAGTDTTVDRRGGMGLVSLAERVAALGGTLTAGPRDPSGWRVTAFMPTSVHGR